MPDAFISYSRKNIAFARLMIQALENNKIQAWIDWQDIPPSTDWLAEVYEAIEGSDAFIFIISEHSVASEVCSLEIAHAVKNNKRMIPIVVNEVEPSTVPAPLAALQWIFFNQEDQFSSAIQNLIEAIQIDQDWVKEHTRLQNRALEWNRRDRPKVALLRGQDLIQAEYWIARAAGMDPAPSTLQTEFIFASRKETARRQRIGIIAAAASIVVALGLGIWSWTQRSEAIHTTQARATAEFVAMNEANTRATAQAEAINEEKARATAQALLQDQIQTVSSRFLAAQASSMAKQANLSDSENLDLGLLLSLEALQQEDNLETRTALFASLTARPYLDRFLFRASDIIFYDMFFNPQGDLVVINYYDQELLIFDLNDGKLLYQIASPHRITNVRHDLIDTVKQDGIRFNVDGTQMISHADDRSWMLWDATSYTPIGDPFTENIDRRSIVSISPDFDLLATLEQNVISIWERESGALMQVLDNQPKDIGNLPLFSQDAQYFIVARGDGALQVYEIESGEMVRSFEPDPDLGSLVAYDINPQGTRLGITGAGSILLYDLTTGEEIASYKRKEKTEYKLIFDPNGQAFLAYTEYPYNQELKGYEEFTYLETLGENNFLLSRFSPVSTWPYETIELLQAATFPLYQIDPGSLRIVTLRRNQGNVELLVFDTRTIYPILESGSFNHPMDDDYLPQQILFHPSQENILAVGQCNDTQDRPSCEVTVWELSEISSVLSQVTEVKGPIQALTFNPQGELLAVAGGDGTLTLWDWHQNEQFLQFEDSEDGIASLGFTSDGKYLVSRSHSGNGPITVWELETGKIFTRIDPESIKAGEIKAIAIHPERPWLGIACGNRAMLWDIEQKNQVAELMLDESINVFNLLAFHPDGSQLATGGEDGVARWDMQSLKPLSLPSEGSSTSGEVQFLGYDPSGNWLVSGNLGVYRLYDHETGKLIGELAPTIMEASENLGFFDILPTPSFNSNGSRMVAYARGNELLFWRLDLESWQAAACQVANRNLTLAEWKAYMGDEPYRETCP